MPATQKAGAVRRFVTRTLAAGSLLALYAVGTVATTGAMLTATTTSAEAWYRGRGYRRGYRRGWRGRGYVVCRHRYYSSRRVCYRRW